ncbi:LPS export ABC transporter periplasmic protein LptC [uncultured Thiodictyon sp.]|uniref:LPS export ABC transporter periplasmic protein LptC n=1 Tax=uncultured Thiodictyon sp. TaxID=1846217 RepID=UPI0025E01716|nr:LPS export ABC transporter periplasmic protein LptC [uncultured Thiodictyon sp.]
MWTTRQGRLAILFAVLATLTWWVRHNMIEQPPKPVRERTPKYIVSDFTAVETDATGRPARRLAARQLREYVEEDLGELDLPRLTLFDRDGGPPWEISAQLGFLLNHNEEIHLLEHVKVDRVGTATSRSFRLTSSEMRVWPKREYAQGDQPVRLTSDRDWLTAPGMRLWYAHPSRAEFPGRAHILIAPTPPAAGHSPETTR